GIRAFHVTGVQTCALPISMLSRLVEDALTNNQEILAAAARLKAARANVRAVDARDALLTDVAVEGGAQGEEVLDGGGDSTDTGADRKSVVEGKRVGRGGAR